MSQSMQLLLELAQRECDSKARSLAVALEVRGEAQSRTAQVDRYREEYAGRLRTATSAGVDGDRLRALHAFLARLDEAAAAQARDQAEAEARCTRAQAEWAGARSRVEAYLALLRRRNAAAALKERRGEQRREDELAARAHARETMETLR